MRFVDVRPDDCALDLDDLARKLDGRVKLLALTCASNAVGTMPDVKRLTRLAHDAGVVLEEGEDLERGRARHKQAGPAGIGTEIERVLPAVPHRIGKVGLVGSLLPV